MIAMPFPDTIFDLVLSSLAIHNIKGERGASKYSRRGSVCSNLGIGS
jgi:ubiquinone/menaquinone biosynthesis C-methylase UbiE